jgi:hypothetical protein
VSLFCRLSVRIVFRLHVTGSFQVVGATDLPSPSPKKPTHFCVKIKLGGSKHKTKAVKQT